MVVELTMMTAVASRLCHSSSVCVRGIKPLMANNAGGIDDLVAISIAADEDNPIAHTDPLPNTRPLPPRDNPSL